VKRLAALVAVSLALAVLGALPSGSRGVAASHPAMVFVPSGRFVMGRTEADALQEQQRYGGLLEYHSSATPRRVLDLAAFWIDRTEVTNAMYSSFVRATGHAAPDEAHLWAAPYRWVDGVPPAGLEGHPVTLVSFDDAQAYCRWRGLGLPTEEQWEKAARGSDGRTYPWGERYSVELVAGADRRAEWPLDRIETWTAWWQRVYRGRMRGRLVGTFPVGRFPAGASPYGALDMAGNVFEWVDAFFDAYPGATRPHPEFGMGYRVVRGGDWYLDRIYQQAAARLRAPADHRVPTIGFRCACGRADDRHAPMGGTP
jgi:sulfatase modifying factor 1